MLVIAHLSGGYLLSHLNEFVSAVQNMSSLRSLHAVGRATESDPLRQIEALPGWLLTSSYPVHWTGAPLQAPPQSKRSVTAPLP